MDFDAPTAAELWVGFFEYAVPPDEAAVLADVKYPPRSPEWAAAWNARFADAALREYRKRYPNDLKPGE